MKIIIVTTNLRVYLRDNKGNQLLISDSFGFLDEVRGFADKLAELIGTRSIIEVEKL
jgi:hypothetical protein